MQVTKQVILQCLGDVIGCLSYFGACAWCRVQFMSTHDRMAVINGQHVCARCAMRGES